MGAGGVVHYTSQRGTGSLGMTAAYAPTTSTEELLLVTVSEIAVEFFLVLVGRRSSK